MDSPLAKSEQRRGRNPGPRPDPRRIEAVRARLLAEGQTITDWARAHGETPVQVSKVLSGTRACISGESHRIAVKLGIKDGAPAPQPVDA